MYYPCSENKGADQLLSEIPIWLVCCLQVKSHSARAIDQEHEQAKAVIKGEGDAIGVTEDPSALRRWMVDGPEVSRLATEYEIVSEAKDTNEKDRHHEQAAPEH